MWQGGLTGHLKGIRYATALACGAKGLAHQPGRLPAMTLMARTMGSVTTSARLLRYRALWSSSSSSSSSSAAVGRRRYNPDTPPPSPPPRRPWMRRIGRALYATLALVVLALGYQRVMQLLSLPVSLYASLLVQIAKASRIEDATVLHLALNEMSIQDSPLGLDDGSGGLGDVESLVDSRERVSLFDLVTKIRHAAQDDRITRIILDLNSSSGDTSLGWAACEEIRSSLCEFSRRKRARMGPDHEAIVAYASNYSDQKAYFLAQAADRVLMAPTGLFYLPGLSASGLFFRDALDHAGVVMHVEAREECKSAVAGMTMVKWNDATRENLSNLLHDIQAHVGLGHRVCDVPAYADVISRSPFFARDAAALGMVNGVDYLRNVITAFTDAGAHVVPWRKYSRALDLSRQFVVKFVSEQDASAISRGSKEESLPLSHEGPQEAHKGGLLPDGNPNDHSIEKPRSEEQAVVMWLAGDEPASKADARVGLVFCDSGIGNSGRFAAEKVAKQLARAAHDPSINAIIFRVNSPGGDAVASDVMHNAVEQAKLKKPVIASYGNTSASGGYYATCGANRIFADATTVTGSIGVFGMRPDVSEAIHKVRVNSDVVETDNSTFMNVFEKMSDADKQRFKRLISGVYDDFKQRVSEGRGLSADAVQAVAGGRIYSGRRAVGVGLVDELGGLYDALRYSVGQLLGPAAVAGDFEVVRPTSSRTQYMFKTPDGKLVDVVIFPKPDRLSILMHGISILREDDGDDGGDALRPADEMLARLRLLGTLASYVKPALAILGPLVAPPNGSVAGGRTNLDGMIRAELPPLRIE